MDDNNEEAGSSGTSSGFILSKQVDSIAAKLQESELADDNSSSTPTNLLRNLTEIQLLKKGKEPYAQVDNVEQGASETLCIIPDTEKSISKEGGSTDYYIIADSKEETLNACVECCLQRKSKFKVTHKNEVLYICDNSCLKLYKQKLGDKMVVYECSPSTVNLEAAQSGQKYLGKFILGRKCGRCEKNVLGEKSNLSWEMMEFCNDSCLAQYQAEIGSHCSYCQITVHHTSMGKYCVRFGYNIRQFCSNVCLEEFKKGLKLCSYCQKDISGEDGFLAPIGDKAQFKEFCTKMCMEKYDAMCNSRIFPMDGPYKHCAVCRSHKPVIIEYVKPNKVNSFCGEPCFVAFKFVNNVSPDKCINCQKYFDSRFFDANSAFIDDEYHRLCSKSCLNIFIITHRKIVCCSWCKVKKYNFDMILQSDSDGQTVKMCSLNCLSLYQSSVNEVTTKKISCVQCQKSSRSLYHLKMSDGTINSFCSYACVIAFQSKNAGGSSVSQKKSVATTEKKDTTAPDLPIIPIITNVQSLATVNGPPASAKKSRTRKGDTPNKDDKEKQKNESDTSMPPPPPPPPPPKIETRVKHQFIIKSPMPPSQRNIATMCKVITATKESTCIPTTETIEIQTDEVPEKTSIIPLPVPIYIPAPVWMYSAPYPVPFPFPLPLPVPIFIPSTKNSAKGIMKEIQKIQIETPTDPLEAELLTMAEMVADDKKEEPSASESEGEINTAENLNESAVLAEPTNLNTSFGEISDTYEPAVDLEGTLTTNTISTPDDESQEIVDQSQIVEEEDSPKGRKRAPRPQRKTGKRGRRPSQKSTTTTSSQQLPAAVPPSSEPMDKPDANMCLKFTFGVNAWKQWVALKNAEIERSSHRTKLFKPDILQLTADELNYSLCLFVKEVRKPNGQEYAPDTIYYLCLGIQQYLLENSRIDNIFCDAYYERFTACLDEVARKFSVLYNDAHYIVTRVEEEHLWESKQLGAHSPHVLLSTLMFFNTKHFNLSSVEDHMQLSFSHIMKHWKRSSNQSGSKVAGSRNVLLRFYPPHTSTDLGVRKKKVYEQQENEENPLRCPVKLYEFYLSKCPESVKTRNDVFYLLPERSCVPDSPVWYSTTALPQEALEKMLHRVKMVKEVNVALLTS